ncbi:galactose-specific lectin nattectin-like [Lepisosteus oculatus]|uniref:galactose-specific lectin nattectin-like n=1 Tax=Lepisosteus oculatus TaxID=7918 RepID=UPI0035F512E4
MRCVFSALICILLTLSVVTGTYDCQCTCPTGWMKFDGFCYKFFTERMTWADANLHCHKLRSLLPSVHDEHVNNFLLTLIRSEDDREHSVWLGGMDCIKEGAWTWGDRTQWNYTLWATGEPNNYQQENCLQLNWKGNSHWNDFPCTYKLPFICARPVL